MWGIRIADLTLGLPNYRRQHAILRVNCSYGSKISLKEREKTVQAPPPEFDYRKEVSAASRALICAQYPELGDLVKQGSIS